MGSVNFIWTVRCLTLVYNINLTERVAYQGCDWCGHGVFQTVIATNHANAGELPRRDHQDEERDVVLCAFVCRGGCQSDVIPSYCYQLTSSLLMQGMDARSRKLSSHQEFASYCK